MAYEPTNWKTGDVVTSAKLNKLENAVAQSGGVYIVHDVDGTLDKTFNEIASAIENNAIMIVVSGKAIFYGFVDTFNNDFFEMGTTIAGHLKKYVATSREAYPTLQEQQ